MNSESPHNTPPEPKYRVKKLLASIMMVMTFSSPVVVIGISAGIAGIFAPQSAQAQWATTEVVSVPQTIKTILEKIFYGLVTAAKVGIKNALRSFLEKIAYDTAVWLGSGDENQKPLLFTKDAGTYLQEAGDAAAGEFLNTLASENGFLEFNLCDLPEIEALNLKLTLPTLLGKEPYEPSCSFSEIKQEFNDTANYYRDMATQLMDDPLALINVTAQLDSGENALSSLLATMDEAIGVETAEERKATLEQLQSGAKASTADVSGYIQTPAFLVEAQMIMSLNKSSEGELIQTDNIVADAASVFINTLASKLVSRLTTGIISFFTETDVAESVASGGGSTVSSSSGVSGAEEQFAEFKTTAFNTGGTVDILSHFASCPEQGAEATNCVVNESMRLAIDEQLSLAEAIDQGVIDETTLFGFGSQASLIMSPEEGISLRNIKILKSYGVVPVGWQLAAEYIHDFDSGTTYTIGSMIDNFDRCSSTDYSPYCGLVDPYWTLKAPQVFCNLEGFGSTLTVDQFIDSDGSEYTPDERMINRLTSCIDPQTCLTEDDSGFCKEYGYCTKYDRIYRFDGKECPSYLASCELFITTDEDEAEVGYLKNTLNYNDCTTDNRGCGWLCSVYDATDDGFRCEDQDVVYQECDSTQATYDAAALTCTCTDPDTSETCDIAEGGFYCTTDSEATCMLDTETEDAAGIDAAINFDDDAEDCDEDNNGCTEFLPVQGGANLVFNGSFEHFAYDEAVDGDYETQFKEEDDANIDYLQTIDEAVATTFDAYAFGYYGSAGDGADATLAGEPCTTYNTTHYCHGWEYADGVKARAIDESLYGNSSIQLQDQADNGSGATGYILNRFDTGQPLGDRTFALIFGTLNNDTACTANYWVAPDGVTGTDLDAYKVAYTYEANGTFETVNANPVTFAESVTETVVNVGFEQGNGCELVFEQVKLEENYGSSGFDVYGDSDQLAYLNTGSMLSCEVDEVGCDLFTPLTGESELDVPGRITNPFSEDCGDGDDFTNPECSQCTEDYVGCDYYIEEEMPYNAPIKDIYGFSDTAYHTGTLADAVANRTGLYCDGTSDACNSDADCDSGVLCLPSLSIIPSTGTTCSANDVGCEQYVNIDEETAGGEGIYYYKYIRQCVKETVDQVTDDEIRIYYTFEGDDITGYQLRAWTMKKSNYDEDATTGDAAPCVNLDLYDWNEDTVQSPEADCVDAELVAAGTTTITDCDPSDEADCAEFWDSDGNNYYRYMSETVTVSDDCNGYRNTLDNRIYYTIASESESCSASANMCREYKGSQSGNVQTILSDDFDYAVWDGGTSSSTTVTASVGQSMEITAGGTAEYSVAGIPEEDESYVTTFWAKAATSGDKISMFLYSDSITETTYIEQEFALTDNWKKYTVGPGVLETISTDLDEVFRITNNGAASVYIDNIEVAESSSHYLILDSADTCNGYEGCEHYQDTDGDAHYLKSFAELCDENAVGCEALIQTRNSTTPYYTLYNGDNEYDQDDIIIDTDAVVTYAVTDGAVCSDTMAGCTIYGEPDLDAYGDVESFTTVYKINDPDTYTTTICQEQQRGCDAFMGGDGSEYYFKNPGDKSCEYNSGNGEWLITGTDDACPLQNDNSEAAPSQPKGSVCNGGLRDGKICSYDTQCPADDADTSTYRCVSDGDGYGWAGTCEASYTGCTQYLDPQPFFQATISGGAFETDMKDEDDITAGEGDGIPDGWIVYGEGESGSGAGVDAGSSALEFTDVTDANSDIAMTSETFMLSESDVLGSINQSGYVGEGVTTFHDVNSGNPSSAEPLVIGSSNVYFHGYNGESITIETTNDDDGTTDTTTVTLPTVADSSSSNVFFYVEEGTGTLYWADSDNNGVAIDGSDALSAAEAMVTEHLAADGGGEEEAVEVSFEVNGFYDTSLSTGTIGCDTFTTSTAQVFEGSYSFNLDAGSNAHCMAEPGESYTVDENKYYTLTANVYTDNVENQFAVGLLYFDSSGNELYAGELPENYAVAAYEGSGRSEDTSDMTAGQWMRFHTTIGPNIANEFPSGTYYIKPFLEVASMNSDTVYFDNFEFYENFEYTYINNTVDGATESDKNSCAGEVSQKEGCVAFRDASANDMTYLSSIETEEAINSSYTVETCEFNSGVEADSCRSNPDAADANSVLKVRNDRECANWLACKSAQVTTANDGTEQTTCYSVGMCEGRNEDTGVCTDWVNDTDDPGYDDDQSFISAPGNTEEVFDYRNHSGLATVGAEWGGSCSILTGMTCNGGANDGQSCMPDFVTGEQVDCSEANTIYGNYPVDWMPEQGQGGAEDTSDLVEDGDFEDVLCTGDSSGTINGVDVDDTEVEVERDKTLHCTLDRHCRTNNTESEAKSYLKTAGSHQSVDQVRYEAGWCENFSASGWSGWTAYGSADATIIDYDILDDQQTFITSAAGAGEDQYQTPVGAYSVDLNNVVYVEPTASSQTGIQTSVDSDITTGLDYTITFDAAYTENPSPDTDFIQVGLDHYDTDGVQTGTDYFEIGSKMTDVVFVVDSSTSMDAEIARVVTASANLVSGFAENQIDYQIAIVTTGKSAGPHILDYDNYSYAGVYNNGGTISRGFTSDIDEFNTAMTYIKEHMGSGSEYNYQALVDIANNTFPGDSDQSLNFRSGAVKFVIILTDEVPATGDPYVAGNDYSSWEEEDETDLKSTISSDAFILNSIVTTDVQGAYDDISSNMGGSAEYNLDLESYSSILEDIIESIDENTSAFTFDTTWKSYALGPITIEEKVSANDTSTLFITQAAISGGTPFILDNISLKPALEVNKQGNEASEGSTNMIARECRGYPEDDSKQCNYTKDGVIYTGWKGYCLEHDDYNEGGCVLWWPVDVLSGEPDMTSVRTRVQYTGKYPVYHCLVAKGNSRLGACSDDGTICIEDTDCNGTCIAGEDSDTYTDGSNNGFTGSGIQHTISSSSYTVTHEIDNFYIDTNSQNGTNTGSNKDYGHFEDFDPSDVEKLIHVSEIERIRFDQGTPDINGDVEADSPGDLGITTLDTEALETTYDEPLVQYGRYFSNTGDAGNDTGQDLKYGFTRGVWCGDDAGGVERCSDSMNDDELEGMSISYIHAVALNDEDAYSTDYACGGETCDGKFPFTGVLADGGDVWGCHGQVEEYDIDCDDDGFGDSDDVTLPSGFEARDLSDYDQGANVFVMRIKFQDGYPYKLFYGFWNGTKDWDYNEVNDITFKYYLKEPCLLAVAGADEDANATPWMDRATNGSSYIVPLNSAGSGYSSTMTTANSFFGSMMMESNTDTPITIDGWTEAFSGDDLVDFFAAGESDPPFIGPRSGIVGSSLPYACIGKCTEMTCQEDYSASWIDNDCDSGNWIGFDGVCDYDGAPSGNDVVLCNDDSDCTTYGAGSCEDSMLSGDGVGASYSNYNEQLNAAADAAWDRYRLLFADVPESWVYAVDQDTEDDNRNQGTMSRTLFSTLSESGDLNLNGIKNDFDDMEECSSSTRDTDDYCGIRPYIENLEINNSSSTPLYLNHGDQVSLTFDSYADGNQEPIQTIRVIWEDDDTTSAFDQTLRTSYDWEAAATIGHNLTYTYTCDPVNDVSYDDDEGMCKYHVKVQLIDNWDFCSGETQTGTVRGSDCTSFDYYDGEIWVAP